MQLIQLYLYNLSCTHNYNTRASNTYYTQCAPLPCQETLRRMWTNAKSSHEKLMRQTEGIRSLLEKNLLINIKSEHVYFDRKEPYGLDNKTQHEIQGCGRQSNR